MRPIFDINSLLINKSGFSNGLWVLIGAILFALLCVLFLLSVRRGRVKPLEVVVETGWTLLWYFGVQALSLITHGPGGKSLWTPEQPVWVWCPAAVVLLGGYLW